MKMCGDFVMALIVVTDADSPAAIRHLLARVGFILVPSSILLIKYYPELGRGYEMFTWTPTVTGVTTGKNLLGMVCLICGVGSLRNLLDSFRSRKHSRATGQVIAQATLLGMILWLFWQANSVTALSCFAIAVAVIIATWPPMVRQRAAALHVLVASTLAVSFSVLFLNVGAGILTSMGRDASLTGRTDVWDIALRFAGSPIFGTGFESFWLGQRLERIWSVYWWHPNEAHNGYLEMFLNLGAAGVAIFAVVLVAGYRNILGLFRQDSAEGRFRLAYFVSAIAYNFTEAGFRTFQPIWVLFLATTMATPDLRVHAAANCLPTARAASLPVVQRSSPRLRRWVNSRRDLATEGWPRPFAFRLPFQRSADGDRVIGRRIKR